MVWVVLGLVIVLGGALVVFNRLVQLRNRAAGSWSDIDVQLKRRHDLVGNLVEAVKGYAYHERQVLKKVARRARAPRAPAPKAIPAPREQPSRRCRGRWESSSRSRKLILT